MEKINPTQVTLPIYLEYAKQQWRRFATNLYPLETYLAMAQRVWIEKNRALLGGGS